MLACEQANVPLQRYAHRSDLPCGSTIGPVTAPAMGIPTVDVGAPQLAMHSARELCGASEPSRLRRRPRRLLGARPLTVAMDLADARHCLGVRAAASWAEVRVAYRAQIAAAHPDRPGGDPRRAATVTEAYAALEAAHRSGDLKIRREPAHPASTGLRSGT